MLTGCLINKQYKMSQNTTTVEAQPKSQGVSKSGRLTEIEIIKLCVVNPKYTKEIEISTPDGKEDRNYQKARGRIFRKVFATLSRYLESQVKDKGRCVEFPLCGKFIKRKDQSESNYGFIFIPSLEFLSAGHFQFPENEYNISPLSKSVQVLSGVTQQTVSSSALSVACGVGIERDHVMLILKEIFTKFIEENRKGKECLLDLKIGFLHAYPNSDLQFELNSSESTQEERFLSKIRTRTNQSDNEYKDNQTVITFTLGQQSQISIKTPLTSGSKSTTYSRVSQTAQKQGSKTLNRKGWYSNNNRRNQEDVYSNVAYSQFSQNMQNRSVSNELATRINQNEYLKGNEAFETFVLRKMNQRPGKRIIFQQKQEGNQPQRELLSLYLSQMRDKAKIKLEEKQRKIMDEIKIIEREQREVEEDVIVRDKQVEEKREKFKEGIEEMKQQIQVKRMIEKQRNDIEDIVSKDFFPFTHGDNIERERHALKQELRAEFLARAATAVSGNLSTNRSVSQPMLQNIPHQTTTALDHLSRLTSTHHQQSRMPATFDPKHLLQARFQTQTDPVFFNMHKTTIVRRPDDKLVQSALEKARKRYEEQLMLKRMEEAQLRDDMRKYTEEKGIYYEEVEAQRQILKEQNRLILKLQMEEEHRRREEERLARKEALNLTYGPVETEDIEKLLQDRKEAEKHHMRTILMDQMKEKNQNTLAKKEQRILDWIKQNEKEPQQLLH
ncbi:hypothetical protein FGO68_gene2673 [Halteria grandinella]|uniref:CCDC81 HU domain-containing protein n=1 Tax=Halteria grandinella TaxID=5974 RepID=A0A8J8NYI0_HALGN|nr:hypothetical protein FGO68_gene2673 [Halteria grandinella]